MDVELHWDWHTLLMHMLKHFIQSLLAHALTPARFKALKALDKLVGLLSNQPEEVSVVVLTEMVYGLHQICTN